MRIGRVIIIPAILALGVAAAALSASEMSATASHASTVHVEASVSANPDTFYHS
jgi:hypothetical protein